MNRACVHERIRRMRFEDVLGRSERSELSQAEAGELLGGERADVPSLAGPPPRGRDGGPVGRVILLGVE